MGNINITNALRARGIGVGKKLEGTAAVGDVRSGKSFMNADGGPNNGTLVTRDAGGAISVTPTTTATTLQPGIYDNSIAVAGDADLVAGNIKTGVNLFNVAGTFTADADAVAANILASKTAYVNGVKITGTMVDRSGAQLAASAVSAIVSGGRLYARPPLGYYDGVASTVYADDADFVAANIKTGVDMFGLAGTFTADANAVAGNIILGKTAYVNGVKVTGTIPYRTNTDTGGSYPQAAGDSVYDVVMYLKPPAGYYDGSVYVRGAFDGLRAANIKAGVTIGSGVGGGGVLTGTLVDGTNMKKFATGTITTGSSSGNYVVTGLTFQPTMVWIKSNTSIHTGLVGNKNHNPDAYVLNGNVYKTFTTTADSFSIYNNILLNASTTWYAWE